MGLFTSVHQHVSFQNSFVSRYKAALLTVVGFLTGMKVTNMLIELYRVVGCKRAEATVQFLIPWMSLPFVLLIKALI